MDVLNACLETVNDWMGANKPKLSPNKIEVLLVNKQGQPGVKKLVCSGWCSSLPKGAGLQFGAAKLIYLVSL